jgi:D-alanyl-D-alanine carboxypeptidase/D-alanyl-D-alanine-endopeptidase (penicillin-binding protein 4)
MAEMVTVVNKRSQNLHAEMLLRLAGWRLRGRGTLEAGQEAAEALLTRLGVSSRSWHVHDGSGLSRIDELTTHGLVDLLAAMDRHPHAAVFRASLPIAGVDGSLSGRMRGTVAEGRVTAKTGSVRHVNALAGYVTTRGGERLAFAILLNHHTGEDAIGAIDDMARVLAGS